MEILFVVDSEKDIEQKISLLEVLGTEIKFFVNSKCAVKLVKNKYVMDRIVSMYSNNVNESIDKYFKSPEYKPTATLVYFASAELNSQIVNNLRENLQLKPETIYIKKKLSWWGKVKLWFYQKITHLIFGVKDEYASTKLQYFSKDVVEVLVETSFKNHIFTIPDATTIQIDEQAQNSYYDKPKFNKNCLYNPIAFCLILICYVVLERFLSLPFWVYFLVVALLLVTIINLIIMIVVGVFDKRYRK